MGYKMAQVFWKRAVGYLSGEHNYFTWLADTTWGKSILKDRAVSHYTSEVKPWNWLEWDTREDTFYGKSYIASIWTEWWAVADAVMADHTFRDAAGSHALAKRHASCQDPKIIKAFTRRSFRSHKDQLTVLLISPASARPSDVEALVKKYASMKAVRAVVVAWGGTGQLPAVAKVKKIGRVKIKFFRTASNPNTRFIPQHSVETQHVLLVHVEIELAEKAVDFMLLAATEVPGRVVSPLVSHSSQAGGLVFMPTTGGQAYDLVDARVMLVRADLFFLYTCAVDLRLLRLVQDRQACHGMLMNIVASAVSEHPPLHVAVRIKDSGTPDPAAAAKCFKDLGGMISDAPLTLQQAVGSAATFDDTGSRLT